MESRNPDGFRKIQRESPRKLARQETRFGKILAGGGNPKPMRPLDLPKPIGFTRKERKTMDGKAISLQGTLDQLRMSGIEVYNDGRKVKVTNAYVSLNRLIVDIEDV